MRKSIMLVAAAAAAFAAPASADVKAGVDAWSRGDYLGAVRQWQDPAEAGDPDAQFNLGQAYKLGKGVPADLRKAEELFRKAALQGHLQAGDNYGLLLFQTGRREQAMAWLVPSAERGEPRAEYVLGIAHFNGDLVPRDQVRAYALMSRAAAAGLDQARTSLAVMDQQLSLEQRQQAAALAAALEAKAEALRSAQVARAGLDSERRLTRTEAKSAIKAPPFVLKPEPKPALETPPAALKPEPVMAGADYANPVVLGSNAARSAALSPAAAQPTPTKPAAKPAPPAPPKPTEKAEAPKPASEKPASPKPAVEKPKAVPAKPTPAAASGAWQVQLGAFGVRGNAEALSAKLDGRPALGGRRVSLVAAGKLTRVLAGPFPTSVEAEKACAALGQPCMAVKK